VLRAPVQVLAGVVTARVRGRHAMSEEVAFTWFVGVDWGSERHQACIVDHQGNDRRGAELSV
jgi:hypothetical protein